MRKFPLFIFVAIILIATIAFYISKTSHWDIKSRFRVVEGERNGNISLLLFDPKRKQISVYPLNPKTQIETAYGLGEYKIESLWKLGEQEKKGGGVMLRESLIRGFALPIEGYVKGTQTSSFSLAKTLLFGTDTDISMGDRAKLALFTLQTKLVLEEELKPEKIILTGEEIDKITDGIVTITSRDNLNTQTLKALSNLISNLGGKVLDVSTSQSSENDRCEVEGTSNFAQKLARVLKCNYTNGSKDGVSLTTGNNLSSFMN